MDDQGTAIPEGYAPHFRKSPVTDAWEPLYSRISDGVVHMAVQIKQQHCNGRGFAHGGLISALADNAMGLSVAVNLGATNTASEPAKQQPPRGSVTVHLGIDFLGTGKIGDLVEFKPRVLKVGRSLAFVDCVVEANTVLIARANATFRLAD